MKSKLPKAGACRYGADTPIETQALPTDLHRAAIAKARALHWQVVIRIARSIAAT